MKRRKLKRQCIKKPRNKFERKLDRQLKRAKVRYEYETTRIPYVLAGHYIPDWIIHTSTGLVFIEAKGYLRPEHKRKMAAVKRQHPELDIRFVFYAKKTKDIKWAEKIGFRWAVEKIPQEWLNGL